MTKSQTQQLDEIKEKVKRFIASIREEGFDVKEAYLYGSYAKGDFRKNSDIDVCIVSDRFAEDWDKNERYLWRKSWRIDPRLEPIGYTPKEFKNSWVPLVSAIKENHIKMA